MSSIATRKMLSLCFYTGTGTSLLLESYPGDFQVGEMAAGDTDESAILDRGSQIQLTEGDDQPVPCSFQLYHDGKLTDAVQRKVVDFLQHTGSVATDVTTDPGGRVWCLRTVATITNGGIVTTHSLPNVRYKWSYATSKEANTISCTGTGYHGAGHTRPCVTV